MNRYKHLEDEGYYLIREIPGHGTCGLFNFMFTVGLCVGIDEQGYYGRYCYATKAEAAVAITIWSGEGDPPLNWIKYKGYPYERSNTMQTKIGEI